MFKKLLSLSICSITLALSACSNQPMNQTNVSQVAQKSDSNVYVADIGHGKLGASFKTTINFNEGFNIKSALGNVSGTPAKLSSDIAKVDAYLLELSTAPAPGSDPLASVVTNGTVLNIAKTGSSFTILFQNVPANTAGKSYYVGLVAKDSAPTPKVISKNPSPDWTVASLNKGLAITSGGGDVANPGSVSVNSSFAVSSLSGLTASISLLDAVGAQIQSTATVTNGTSTLPAIAAN